MTTSTPGGDNIHTWRRQHSHLEETTSTPGGDNIHTWRRQHSHLEETTFTPGGDNIHTWRRQHPHLEETTFTPGEELASRERVDNVLTFHAKSASSLPVPLTPPPRVRHSYVNKSFMPMSLVSPSHNRTSFIRSNTSTRPGATQHAPHVVTVCQSCDIYTNIT